MRKKEAQNVLKKAMRILLSLSLLFLVAAGCSPAGEIAQSASPGSQPTDEPPENPAGSDLKVALLLGGYINDGSFCEPCYGGLKKAERDFGVSVAYSEALTHADYQSTMWDYASRGYQVIICAGDEFADAAKTVAASFPETKFAIILGNEAIEPNVAAYRFNTSETGFLAGVLAALYSESGVVGFVCGSTAPHIQDSAEAFEAGAKYINPEAKVLSGYTETWTDVAKGKELAMALIEQGADALSANADACSLGVIDAVKSKGLAYIGYNTDQNEISPENIPASAIQSNEFLVYRIVSSVVDGTFKPELGLYGINEGAISVSDIYDIGRDFTDEDRARLEEVTEGIKDGSLKAKGILPASVFER